MSSSKARYEIVFESNAVKKAWFTLKGELPDEMDECSKFLRTTPRDRLKSEYRLKKLKAPYKGTLQYNVTRYDARVWYIVDNRKHQVVVRYAGHHPDKY